MTMRDLTLVNFFIFHVPVGGAACSDTRLRVASIRAMVAPVVRATGTSLRTRRGFSGYTTSLAVAFPNSFLMMASMGVPGLTALVRPMDALRSTVAAAPAPAATVGFARRVRVELYLDTCQSSRTGDKGKEKG